MYVSGIIAKFYSIRLPFPSLRVQLIGGLLFGIYGTVLMNYSFPLNETTIVDLRHLAIVTLDGIYGRIGFGRYGTHDLDHSYSDVRLIILCHRCRFCHDSDRTVRCILRLCSLVQTDQNNYNESAWHDINLYHPYVEHGQHEFINEDISVTNDHFFCRWNIYLFHCRIH